jgi:hypothetical protein
MSRLHQTLCAAALVALLPLAACSSNGRLAYSGGLGGGSSSGGGSGGSGAGAPTPPSSANDATLTDDAGDAASVTLASAGNLAADLEDGELNDANALGRVTVGDQHILGEDADSGLLGVNVVSQAEAEGELATIGLLANGQLISANQVSANGNGDLIGAVAGENRIIGEGEQQQVSLDLLSNSDAQGDVIGVDALSDTQTTAVEVHGGTVLDNLGHGGVLDGVTNAAGALLTRD